MYCENCQEENLKTYYQDCLGSVFCSIKCLKDSQEYRDVDVRELLKNVKVVR